MKQSPLTVRRWGRVEYEKLVDVGGITLLGVATAPIPVAALLP
jgi:hypothetical protein